MNKSAKVTQELPLITPTDLKADATRDISGAMNAILADVFALYLKTKNFHWHLSGPHFRDYHLLFDEQADQIFAMIDPLAERVRKLGGITIHSTGEVSHLQRIKDDDTVFLEPKKMLTILMNDNRDYTTYLRASHKICEAHNDVATCSILEI